MHPWCGTVVCADGSRVPSPRGRWTLLARRATAHDETMSRELLAATTIPDKTVDAATAAFATSPQGWLPGQPRRNGLTWQAEVRLGRLRRPVHAVVGELWTDGPDRWRSLSWTPLAADTHPPSRDPRLPAFSGVLGLRVTGAGPATLLLQGRYDPPGGSVGSALDTLLLRHLAQRTAEDLLADIRSRLTAGAERLATMTGDPT